MSFPKPEFIQNFIGEKISKKKDSERSALLRDHLSESFEETNVRRNYNDLNPNLLQVNKTSAGSSASSASSVLSESDDFNRSRDLYRSAPVKDSRNRHHLLGSDADYETDDSNEILKRPSTNTSNSNSSAVRKAMHKSNASKVPLITSGDSNDSYGGTSHVGAECAEALASYGYDAKNGSKKVVVNSSINGSVYQTEIKGDQFSDFKSSNGTKHAGSNKKSFRNHGYQNAIKLNSDSSEDFNNVCENLRRQSMESDHCHDSSDEKTEKDEMKRKKAMRKLLIASALSFLFMVGEIVGGYLANSLAVMTDASHLLTDVSSFMISILALKMASRPISKKMTFGWHRAEVIGALVSVLTIWVVTAVLVYLAIRRLVTNDYNVNGKDMLITSALAVVFNIIMGLVLHEHGHMHGHSHDHGHHGHHHGEESGSNSEADEGGDSGNVNVRAAFIHVVGDLLQSIGVTVAAFIIYFKPEYKIADPICTFLFSILVLITTITILRDTIIIIMEGSPVNIKYNAVKEKLLEIEGVAAVHDLRIWSLTLNQTVMSAHLAINQKADPSVVLKQATRRLKALYNFHSLTLQVEYYSYDMDSCKKCQPA